MDRVAWIAGMLGLAAAPLAAGTLECRVETACLADGFCETLPDAPGFRVEEAEGAVILTSVAGARLTLREVATAVEGGRIFVHDSAETGALFLVLSADGRFASASAEPHGNVVSTGLGAGQCREE